MKNGAGAQAQQICDEYTQKLPKQKDCLDCDDSDGTGGAADKLR